jgi:DNA-binding NarL/FixJ family response regulator
MRPTFPDSPSLPLPAAPDPNPAGFPISAPARPAIIPLRVLLADDRRLLLEGLANLLEAHGMEIAGMARDGLEAAALARSRKPELILMDIRMPRSGGLAATRAIKAEMPEVKIVMLTSSEEDGDLFEAIKCGACGYLLKSMDAETLVEGLELARQGVPPFSPGLAAKLLASRWGDGEKEGGLAERQVEALTLVSQGFSYREVGERMGLSPRALKSLLAEVMETLHLRNGSQAPAHPGKSRRP